VTVSGGKMSAADLAARHAACAEYAAAAEEHHRLSARVLVLRHAPGADPTELARLEARLCELTAQCERLAAFVLGPDAVAEGHAAARAEPKERRNARAASIYAAREDKGENTMRGLLGLPAKGR
jgi:hypothetical protein